MKKDIQDKFYQQIATDFCCSVADVMDKNNHFTYMEDREGKRLFDGSDQCVLRAIVVNGKLIVSGEKAYVDQCQEKFATRSGSWFMDVANFRIMEEMLAKDGHQLKSVHPFFLPAKEDTLEPYGYEIVKYNQEEILQFEGDERFDEAFCFDERTPDVLAVAAILDGEIIGMAGASADSPLFWQIGINVAKAHEGKGIGSTLVSILKKDIIDSGHVPYYGTATSNLASQRVAAKAGFEVAWVELLSEKKEKS